MGGISHVGYAPVVLDQSAHAAHQMQIVGLTWVRAVHAHYSIALAP